ncbi:MAG: DUF192 domain-containing protein [Chloroflexi bacterium]|nr:DUF192 domain-containing protein [Chloroflexota bacterium]
MARSAIVLALALLGLVSCGPPGPPPPPFVAIEAADATRFVRVEIAETEAQRQRGLMGRTSLDEDAGMLFVWPQDTTSGFWMKDTPLRLSIAFISADGRIVRVFDMEPCTADPCPVYDPGTSYRMALEVRQGALDRQGVRVGDRIRLVR